ncbi:MAG: cytidylate kinase-like family protein [Armatimonadota bacterium]
MIITLSRQAGTNGALIAQLVAQRLGLHVYDRELVDELARRIDVDPEVLTRFDEKALHPVESVLWEWRTSINEEVYGRHLRQALQRIAKEGNAMVVGRGANFLLKCPDCLNVRVIAPLELRVGMYVAGETVSEREAQKWIRSEDRRRREFIRRLFGKEIDDPDYYDLVINLARITPEGAADIVAHAAELRAREHITTEPTATLPQYVEILRRHRRPVSPEIVERQERH